MTARDDFKLPWMWWEKQRYEGIDWDLVEETIREIERVGTETGVGGMFELWAGPEAGMTVSIDVPGEHGWALTYNHDDWTATSIGPVSDGDDVDVKYDGDWESFPVLFFVSPEDGLKAVKHYFNTGTRPTNVEWLINGAERVPAE